MPSLVHFWGGLDGNKIHSNTYKHIIIIIIIISSSIIIIITTIMYTINITVLHIMAHGNPAYRGTSRKKADGSQQKQIESIYYENRKANRAKYINNK